MKKINSGSNECKWNTPDITSKNEFYRCIIVHPFRTTIEGEAKK